MGHPVMLSALFPGVFRDSLLGDQNPREARRAAVAKRPKDFSARNIP